MSFLLLCFMKKLEYISLLGLAQYMCFSLLCLFWLIVTWGWGHPQRKKKKKKGKFSMISEHFYGLHLMRIKFFKSFLIYAV